MWQGRGKACEMGYCYKYVWLALGLRVSVCVFQVSSGGVISTLDGAVGCPVGVALSVSGSVYISDMCSSSIYVVSEVAVNDMK
jgi:hypothetical protein